LVEAGWTIIRAMTLPPSAPEDQVEAHRKYFFAGAHHLFCSIMTMMEAGDEPTPADEERMANVHKELEDFGKMLEAEVEVKGYLDKYYKGTKP
jgi:hypothetical protein